MTANLALLSHQCGRRHPYQQLKKRGNPYQKFTLLAERGTYFNMFFAHRGSTG